MSWADLATDYFVPVCREIFDPYFETRGFGLAEQKPWSLTYRRGRCWFRIHHYVEESPRFSPMLTAGMHSAPFPWLTQLYCRLGLLRRARDGRPILFNEVGLWFAIPSDAPERSYPKWLFSSRDELEQITPRLRDEVVDRWGPALWDQPENFAEVLSRRYRDYLADAERDRRGLDPKKGFAILAVREAEIRSRQAGVDQ